MQMMLLHEDISLTVKEGEVLLSIEEQNSCILIGIGKLGSQIFGDSEEKGRRKRDAVSDEALITFSVFSKHILTRVVHWFMIQLGGHPRQGWSLGGVMWFGKISSRNILVKSGFITHRIVKLRRRARWETGEGSPLSQPSSLLVHCGTGQRDRGRKGTQAESLDIACIISHVALSRNDLINKLSSTILKGNFNHL